jgi:hypothetical protein
MGVGAVPRWPEASAPEAYGERLRSASVSTGLEEPLQPPQILGDRLLDSGGSQPADQAQHTLGPELDLVRDPGASLDGVDPVIELRGERTNGPFDRDSAVGLERITSRLSSLRLGRLRTCRKMVPTPTGPSETFVVLSIA